MPRGLSLILTAALIPLAAPAAAAETHAMIAPDQLQWGPVPDGLPAGAEMAVLAGDPSKDGPFTVRMRAPTGYQVPPHTHPTAELLTIISGSAKMSVGDHPSKEQATTASAGAFINLQANQPHAVWFSEPAIVEIHSTGPFQITYLNPADDPRKQVATTPGR